MVSLAFHIQRGGSGQDYTYGESWRGPGRPAQGDSIDGDPQGSLSSWLVPGRQEHELADLLYERLRSEQVIVSVAHGLDLVGTFGIGGELKKYAETDLYREPFAIHKVIEQLAGRGHQGSLAGPRAGNVHLGAFDLGADGRSDLASHVGRFLVGRY